MRRIYTIGYESTDIDRFVATLVDVGVEALADVRAVTVSRKKGFSKNGLSARLADAGVRYQHFPALGDPKPGREAARAGRYDEFRKIYTDHFQTERSQLELFDLEKLVDSRATCLMCFERDPTVCHRSIVATALIASGGTVFDLYGDVPGRYRNNAAKVPGRNARQGTSPAE